MKKFENNVLNLTAEDGSVHPMQVTSIRYNQAGEVTIRGQFTEPATIAFLNEPLNIPPGRLRPHLYCSALVRFTLDGMRRTAAITHTTNRAWRIINLDLGVAWVPANALRWSELSHQFVLDPNYELDFTTDVKDGMMVYPYNMEPDTTELQYDYKI